MRPQVARPKAIALLPAAGLLAALFSAGVFAPPDAGAHVPDTDGDNQCGDMHEQLGHSYGEAPIPDKVPCVGLDPGMEKGDPDGRAAKVELISEPNPITTETIEIEFGGSTERSRSGISSTHNRSSPT